VEAPLDSETDEDSDAEESTQQPGDPDTAAADSGRDAELPLPLIDGPMRQQVMGILWANWEVRPRRASAVLHWRLSALRCAGCRATC
jgi:hypothetical protein